MAKQANLLEVDMDEVGKCADRYLDIKDDKEKVEENLSDAELALLAALRRAKRQSITLNGHVLSVKHFDSRDRISVRDA